MLFLPSTEHCPEYNLYHGYSGPNIYIWPYQYLRTSVTYTKYNDILTSNDTRIYNMSMWILAPEEVVDAFPTISA